MYRKLCGGVTPGTPKTAALVYTQQQSEHHVTSPGFQIVAVCTQLPRFVSRALVDMYHTCHTQYTAVSLQYLSNLTSAVCFRPNSRDHMHVQAELHAYRRPQPTAMQLEL